MLIIRQLLWKKKYKFQPIPDVDVGVNLDLIDYSIYELPEMIPEMDPMDYELVNAVVDNKSNIRRSNPQGPKKDSAKIGNDSQKIKKASIIPNDKEMSVEELLKQMDSQEYQKDQIKKNRTDIHRQRKFRIQTPNQSKSKTSRSPTHITE